MYIRVVSEAPSAKARIDSPKTVAPSTGACVRFWYHMHGVDVGSLTVHTVDGKSGLGPACWTRKGDYLDRWLEASIDIDPGDKFQVRRSKSGAVNAFTLF